MNMFLNIALGDFAFWSSDLRGQVQARPPIEF